MSNENQDTRTENPILTDSQRVEIVKQDMKSCIDLMKRYKEVLLQKKTLEAEMSFFKSKVECMDMRDGALQDYLHTDKELQDLMKELMMEGEIIKCYE